jgi:S1-C subfamily serine protease
MTGRSGRLQVLFMVLLGGLVSLGCMSNPSTRVAARGQPPPLVSAPPPIAAGLSDTELAKRFGPAVYRVETLGCGFWRSGSAFAIDAHHLVTNNHVVSNDSAPTVRSATGEAHKGRVIGSSKAPDVAVIEVKDTLPVVVGWAPTASLAKGEHVVLFGYPLPARQFTVSPGSIVNFQPPGGRESILANTAIDHGNSGGPALLSDGTAAGVATQMTLPQDPTKRVAIVFTTDTLKGTVQQFLAHPATVLSDCGIGPDYVPPLPPNYNVPAVPPTPPPLPAVPPPSVPQATAPPPDAPSWDVQPAPPSPPPPSSTTSSSTSSTTSTSTSSPSSNSSSNSSSSNSSTSTTTQTTQ